MANEESNPNQGQPAGTPPAGTDGNAQTPNISSDEIKKLIQSETDKVRTHYSLEFKKQQDVIEGLKKSQMTEAELRKYKESQLAERESLLQRKELELTAVDVLKEHNLSPSFRELIIGKDSEETKVRGMTLKTELQKMVEAAVQEKFKAAGRDPKQSSSPAGEGKRTYTRAEIEEMGKRANDRGLPPAERAQIVQEMQAAAKEGRIKS